ncbi:polyprenyl synthetase family protein [Mycobacterium vicinigordonae]|uniref:polyprenyl synthetase family protein n=1 Tax=Mycobacterium vicinigordonae TaxID=1719132 RepID=UPI002483D799|nr:polyprenyl synthetase family protein [Mycobacterium vicinigordonae]
MIEIANPVIRRADPTIVEAALTDARALIEPTQRAALDALPADVRHVAGLHLGWWDAAGQERQTGRGKAIRPALTIACARAAGGDEAGEAAIRSAVAVELVHDFSLLHDDIMDSDLVRRHQPTAWSAFGVS